MVGYHSHGHVDLTVLAVFLAAEGGYFINQWSEHVGIVVRCLALKRHAEAFKAHAGVDYLGGQRFKRAVGTAVVMHEHKVPYFDYLRVVVVDERCPGHLGALGIGAEVDVNLRAGAARTGVAHFPEIVVLVAVEYVVGRQMLGPYRGGLVVALESFVGSAFKNRGIEPRRIQMQNVDKVFPRHINGFGLEIIAERPVSEHLEHSVVVGVESYLLEVVVLAADAKTLLRVGNAPRLRNSVAQNYILELVHTRIGKHQRGVVFDYHRCGGDDAVAL